VAQYSWGGFYALAAKSIQVASAQGYISIAYQYFARLKLRYRYLKQFYRLLALIKYGCFRNFHEIFFLVVKKKDSRPSAKQNINSILEYQILYRLSLFSI
jgi:hypothetical protein